ncbi:MAG TPA: CAP domain-containing protein, partial [Aggregatilineales bacterium]|nr:CAP domain-containing protein [Aggregatilineales bacterium]
MKQKLLFPIIALCVFFGAFATTTPTQSQDMATYMLSLINGLRGGLGLHPYTLNASLTLAAQNQASWMAISEQISHTQPDGSTPRTRAQAAGYSSAWVSENIYMGTSATADIAFQWWINSPIHYRGLTNVNYTEIGIAMSEGPTGYKAYVLVFGNPDGTVRVAPPITTSVTDPYGYANANQQGNGTSGNGTVNSAPPENNAYVRRAIIVGVDNTGNIMHEVQPGDTLGDIALIYGYTWDDLGRIRELNHMTESEGRGLDVGAILLIPPADGTYTPTPGS